MRTPFSPLRLGVFIFALAMLIALVQVGLLTIAFDKLGLSQHSAFILLYASLFGSAINLPLFSMRADRPPDGIPVVFLGLLRLPPQPYTGRTRVAINVGGGLIPVLFSLYLMSHHPIPPGDVILATAAVAAISHLASRPIPGRGIGIPLFIAPFSAALMALMLNSNESAPLAYIAGTLGVLIGADMLRLHDIQKMGTPFASIGGAGTFDGIFITGIVAVLLA
jgi:uncharacterized membrane protein